MCLAGIAILAVGIARIVIGFALVKPYFDSASWDRVDADIKSVYYGPHSGRGGATWRLDCAYYYTYHGRTYKGYRVGQEPPDVGGNWRTPRHEILKAHLDKKEPFKAWVNPADPSESFLFRELTDNVVWPLKMGSFLAVLGAVFLFVGLRRIRIRKRRESRLLQYPDKPWRVEGTWDDFTIRSQNMQKVLAHWGVGIFLLVILSPFFKDPPPLKVLVYFWMPILIALFALWLIGKAVYLTLQYRKYANPTLALPQLPIVPGTQFLAVLLVKTHLVSEHGVQLTFKCVKATTTGSGKSQSVDTKVLHNETKTVTKDMARSTYNGSAIPVIFDVPAGLHDRDAEDNPAYEWTLEMKARTPGIGLSAEFDLPVYAVKDPSLVEKRPAGMP